MQKLTLLIPTIGREKYLANTIKSVLRQTHKNLEIWISENKSSISTKKILKKEKIFDRRIKITKTKRRLSICEHLNQVLKKIKSEYFMVLSDDDQISSGLVEEMLKIIESDKTIQAVLPRQLTIKGNDLILQPDQISTLQQKKLDCLEFLPYFFNGTLNQSLFTCFTFLTKTKEFKKTIFYPEYPDASNSDNIVIVKLACQGKIGFTRSIMYYRVYNKSVGLSTPLWKLIVATSQYLVDVIAVMRKNNSLNFKTKIYLIFTCICGNYKMIKSRFKNIYLPQYKQNFKGKKNEF